MIGLNRDVSLNVMIFIYNIGTILFILEQMA